MELIRMNEYFIIWLAGAGLLGFLASAVFSYYAKLSRRVYLIPYLTFTSTFLIAFFYFNHNNFGELLYNNWLWGSGAGIFVGSYLVKNVFSRPNSRTSTGWNLVLDIVWVGLAYGIIDALFLNVMPVLAVKNAIPSAGCTNSCLAKIGIGAVALAASLTVCLVYHLGYSEFRNKSLGLVLVGNALITLAFIVSGNPLGSIFSHTAMHVAAVVRGPETAIQLPPHLYQVPGQSHILPRNHK
jgi:hypothetical protein